MKKNNYITLMTFIITVSCFIFFKGEVNAAATDFYRTFSLDENDTEEQSFKLNAKCKMTVTVDCPHIPSNNDNNNEDEFWDEDDLFGEDDWDEYDKIYVAIDDSEDEEVFETYIEEFGITKDTVILPAGKYTLYIENDVKCTVTFSGEYISEMSPKKVTLEAGKSKTLKVSGTNEKIRWKSSNTSIATVSNKGVVKAKKAGKATITASFGKKKLQCEVTVKASYNMLSKKMKSYAKKNKDFTFQNVKYVAGGKRCRLYARKAVEKKITEEHGLITAVQPCIELKKSDKKTEVYLRVFVELWKVSYNDVTLSASNLQFSTASQTLTLKHDSGMNDIDYDYSTGCNIGYLDSDYTIAKMNSKSFKKFETMLRQQSLMVTTTNYDGTVFQAVINKDDRNNWKKLLKKYRSLLKEF